jgi:[protein-PII] uridylyltransferase
MNYETLLDHSEDTDAAIVALDEALSRGAKQVSDLKQALDDASAVLVERFKAGYPAPELVRLRAVVVDRVLLCLWHERAGPLKETAALVAVGGYGRGELHPCSDVDIMVLLPKKPSAQNEQLLSSFLTSLWDIGLDIGHSVRTVRQCKQQARDDITIMTTLIEARLLDGPESLFNEMREAVSAKKIWNSAKFFEAKRNEQIERHHRFDDTAYKLEPNVKGSPGGLRDIQMIGWVAKRHFGVRTLDELVQHDFLSPGQLQILKDGEAFLWRVRFGLHVLTGRQENRLLFDHQIKLAKMLGYEDASYTLAVEQLMQRYYRTVMDLSRLNVMLLQLFEEAILMDPDAKPVTLDDQFQLKNGFLQTADDHVFQRNPSALFEMFRHLQQNPDIRGVSAYTIGLVKRNLYLIDEEFRQNPRNHRLFLDILRAREGVTHELRRMNLYGVLGLYIPSFGRIVGRMQYDLFHAYTVDEHTLFVVSNLRRFALSRYDHEFPHCSPLMQSFEKPEIVYLAGLFHDIAKGRGGDHSELGAVDAEAFCLEHGLSKYEARTVSWLVRHHLILSTTAQKTDIGDPDVVNKFAALVGDKTHLDYLYVLTVADVRGTNPNLWNSWKASLFRDLYELTARALRIGLEKPIDREQLILEKKAAAEELLRDVGVSPEKIAELWSLLTEDYFLRHRSEEIAWHTEVLADSDIKSEHGFVDVRKQPGGDGLQAVFYTPQKKLTFAHGTAGLGELGMTIVDARIVPLKNGYSLDTYIFMEFDKRVHVDDSRMSKIRRTLTRVLTAPDEQAAAVTRPAPRQVRMFTTETAIEFSKDKAKQRTVMELVAGDRPGLLSDIGRVFVDMGINIDTAKIMTIGERAEDVFYISDASGKPLSEESCSVLREKLISRLDAKA